MAMKILQKIFVGLLLGGLFFSLLFIGGIYQSAVFAIATLICVYEMQHVFRLKGTNPFTPGAYLFALLYYPIDYYFETYHMLIALVICVTITITERVINKKRTTEDLFSALSLFMYPISFFVFLMLICEFKGVEVGRVGMLMTFAGPLIGDMFAYFVGISVGKRKLIPWISPNKTVEGSIGGLFGGIMGGVLVYLLQPIWHVSLPLWHLMIIGLVCGALGQIGDLFASSIKRWADVKDFGTLFPGHGGMMDRVDSVLLCAPVVFLYFYIINQYSLI